MRRFVVLALVAGCTVDLSRDDATASLPSTRTELPSTGGTATSKDGDLDVVVAPGALTLAAALVIIEGVPSPAAAVALTPMYRVLVEPSTALRAGVSLSFRVRPAALPPGGASALTVAGRENTAGPYDTFTPGEYTEASERLAADVPAVGDFQVIDGAGYAGCACDTTAACEPGCAFCDLDCQPACECDTTAACEPGCACDPACTEVCECDATAACEPGCTCDLDCTAPDGWMCCPSYHFDLECDCGCALPDPACGGLGCTEAGCVNAACSFTWNGPGQAACP